MLGAPTASGKSAVALELAAEFDLEILSADAMQVYRGMDIGTAKPSAEERDRVPHHLVDLVSPAEPFSVADWVREAERVAGEVLARGRVPLVVGGTGFYLRALRRGLPTVPPADPEAQAELWAQWEREGLEPLRAELAAASPADARRAGRNPRRVVRALEIVRTSGRAPAEFPPSEPAFRFEVAVLLPAMAALRPRIAARSRAMFAAGLEAEVRALTARFPQQPTALQAIGYKEVAAALRGECTLEEAEAEVTRATVRYAKRQRTWFRREDAGLRRDALAAEARPQLRRWLDEVRGRHGAG